MSNIVPFENSNLPAFLRTPDAAAAAAELSSGGLGFPSVSIKGKVFTLRRGDSKEVLMRPIGVNDADQTPGPASGIEVIILRGNTRDSKQWYEHGYTEGAADQPDCVSDDGVAPNADSKNPQSVTCAACPRNVWGSRISDDGKKGKECSDTRRLAIATPDHINDPMLVRVPAASLKPMTQYGDLLKKRGVAAYQVLTRLGFDYAVAHPALTFKPVGFVTEAMYAEIMEARETDLVRSIIGMMGSSQTPPALAAPAAAPALAAPVAPPAPKVDAPPAAAAAPAKPPAKPKAPPKVEAPAAPVLTAAQQKMAAMKAAMAALEAETAAEEAAAAATPAVAVAPGKIVVLDDDDSLEDGLAKMLASDD